MENNILQFSVSGQTISRTDSLQPVANCRNVYKAHFDFLTDEWTGIKTAIFKQGTVTKQMILDNNNECTVPWEFFHSDSDTFGYVSVFCGNLMTANRAVVKILKSGYPYSEANTDPTPDVYQQIIALFETKGDSIRVDGNILYLVANGADVSSAELPSGGGGGTGKDGREVELQNSGTAIQWRYVGESEWKDLVQLSEITGPAGSSGPKGDPGEKGADGITPTIGENGNWFLGDEDTGKPSRGEKGEKGDPGESVPQQTDEVNHGTSDTSFTLPPNELHKWGEVDSLTITLGVETEGIVNEYMFTFTSGATATQLTLPSTIQGVPVIEPNTTYQISIVNNLLAYGGWSNVTV